MLCYICLGSNQGNTNENLAYAIESICQHSRIFFKAKSSVYKTEPQGDKSQQWFANQVIAVEYAEKFDFVSADNLMQYLLGIEAGMGRVRDKARRFGPRVIDIDIILFGEQTFSTEWVTVPHPRVLERAFVLIPLQEIAPHIIINGVKICDALAKLDYRLEDYNIYQ